MFTWSEFHRNEKDDFYYFENADKGLKTDTFSVTVNGFDVPVYSCNISKYPFNRGWPGRQRPIDQTVRAGFINLIGDETLLLNIKSDYKFQKAYLKPYSSGVTLSETDGKISFSIAKNGFYVLEMDDNKHLLYIFYNKPRTPIQTKGITHYYGPGIRFIGRVELKSNDRVYVDKDAYLFGSFFAKDSSNIEIFGNGIVDNSIEERAVSEFFDDYPTGNASFVCCNGVSVRGVGFVNADCWCLKILKCVDVSLDGVRIFGQWRYNTDGVDIVNSQRVKATNCFIHSFDDSIVVKGWHIYSDTDSKDILVENCVLWCDWGRAIEIGLETACSEIYNIVFKDCDILRSGIVALDISNGDYAEIHGIRFENINIEVDKNHYPEVFQRDDAQVYDKEGETIEPYIFQVNNRRCPKCYVGGKEAVFAKKTEKSFTVHDVSYKNINVYYYGSANPDGKYNLRLGIRSFVENIRFNNLTVSDVFVNGKKAAQNDFKLETDSSGEFIFDRRI